MVTCLSNLVMIGLGFLCGGGVVGMIWLAVWGLKAAAGDEGYPYFKLANRSGAPRLIMKKLVYPFPKREKSLPLGEYQTGVISGYFSEIFDRFRERIILKENEYIPIEGENGGGIVLDGINALEEYSGKQIKKLQEEKDDLFDKLHASEIKYDKMVKKSRDIIDQLMKDVKEINNSLPFVSGPKGTKK